MTQIGGTTGWEKSLHCPYCGRDTLHVSVLHVGGCLLTLVTCGLFLPLWIAFHWLTPHYRCQVCGKKRRP